MQVIIIENEQKEAEKLKEMLLRVAAGITIQKIVTNVPDSVDYLSQQPDTDLIFCNTEVNMDRAFKIFEKSKSKVPVIYYSDSINYTFESYKYNGIGYMLKPLSNDSVKREIEKFKELKAFLVNSNQPIAEKKSGSLTKQAELERPSAILINWKEKIIPVKIKEIALFSIEFKTTRVITRDNLSYNIGFHLEELEQLCGGDFYRANRQYLINKEAVEEVLQYRARKLFVKLKIKGEFDISIAKAKVPEFLNWLKS